MGVSTTCQVWPRAALTIGQDRIWTESNWSRSCHNAAAFVGLSLVDRAPDANLIADLREIPTLGTLEGKTVIEVLFKAAMKLRVPKTILISVAAGRCP